MPTVPDPAPAQQVKVCKACKVARPLAEFYVANKAKGTPYPRCKPCHVLFSNYPERFADEVRREAEAKRAEREAPTRVCRRCGVEKPRDAFRAKTATCRGCRDASRDPEEVRATQARYRATHREDRKTRARERYYTDERYGPEKHRRWRAANRGACVEATNRYRETHPEINRVTAANRRTRLVAAPGSYSMDDWKAIKAAQDYTCLMCGRREPEIALTVDHVIPLSKGGSNWPENLAGLCQPCNSRKHDKILAYPSRPVRPFVTRPARQAKLFD